MCSRLEALVKASIVFTAHLRRMVCLARALLFHRFEFDFVTLRTYDWGIVWPCAMSNHPGSNCHRLTYRQVQSFFSSTTAPRARAGSGYLITIPAGEAVDRFQFDPLSFLSPMTEAKPRAGTTKTKKKPIYVNLTFTSQGVVHLACEQMGYEETDSYSDCLLFWYGNAKSAAIASTLSPWQFANHFGASFLACNKVELARKFEQMRSLFPSVYDFHPRNFIFPQELRAFEDYIRAQSAPRTFIIKPDKGRAGQRIKLIQGFEGLAHYRDPAVCQEYVSPFLLNRFKFDLRVYVLVTSVNPLRVYIHNENMVRFCTEKYVAPRKANLGKLFCHLTNYAVNKENPKFIENTGDNEDSAHKRGTVSVFAEMEGLGVDVGALQDRIDEVIQLTMLAVQQEYIADYRKTVKTQDERCRLFEILGFDILIDEALKPWLIEVNNNPSLRGDTPFDAELKLSVVRGALEILDLKRSFRKRVTGKHKGGAAPLFDARRESERASATHWRRVLPIGEAHPRHRLFAEVSRAMLLDA
jgi:tubulin polyglutamylase TTLL6/13